MNCQPPVSKPGPFDADDRKLIAERLSALAHPARIEIIQHLAERAACCNKDVVSRMNLAQSTVSQHLKVLLAAGLIRYTPERQRSMYSLDRDALAGVSGALGSLVDCCCAAPSGRASG
ncbi:metalloregulator ArsR/SmtB family transcription factor [Mesorhizobium sp. CAU 1732]|uniref:ArsR/SmtB family transcription factor n=1 Tax=Mesorhizobium sp. CAU 1732 TaxID=3140358 RepID=UPI003261943F